MMSEVQCRRVRKGARVIFRHMFGGLVFGLVEQRRGEHVVLKDRVGNSHAIYIEDILGVVKAKFE